MVPDVTQEEKTLRRTSAAPNLFFGALYAVAGLGVLLTGRAAPAWLASAMAIEVFAIHSFPFMMVIASYEPRTDLGKRVQKISFWTMLSCYILLALKEGGLPGAVAFASLTVSTYLGYLLRRTSPDAVAQLIARWVMSFVAFFVAQAIAGISGDIDKWTGSNRMPVFGLLYFTTIGLLELKGFYQLPKVREIAGRLRTIFENSRKS